MFERLINICVRCGGKKCTDSYIVVLTSPFGEAELPPLTVVSSVHS